MSDDARDEATQPMPQPTTDLTRPRVVLRAEALLVAVGLVWAAWLLVPATWWVLFAAFLLFDLSALGYLRGPCVGAIVYNLGHVAVDRALGFGLKEPDAFHHTHLGMLVRRPTS